MKRLGLLFVLCFCLGAATAALADKTVTYLLAGSAVTSLTFDLSTPGQVNAVVCGHAPLSGGGGFGPTTCKPVVLTSGSIFNSVNTLAAGTALTFWQTQEGL